MEIIGEKINTTRKDVQRRFENGMPPSYKSSPKQAEGGRHLSGCELRACPLPEEEAEDFAWLVPLIQRLLTFRSALTPPSPAHRGSP